MVLIGAGIDSFPRGRSQEIWRVGSPGFDA